MATRIDGRVDHPAERPPQPQAESDAVLATQPSAAQSQAALESGPPAGAVPVAYQESAYDRFPRSPEIALSLARGYERIDGNNSFAIVLYERFIQLAPNHPLRTEAETSINRLR